MGHPARALQFKDSDTLIEALIDALTKGSIQFSSSENRSSFFKFLIIFFPYFLFRVTYVNLITKRGAIL